MKKKHLIIAFFSGIVLCVVLATFSIFIGSAENGQLLDVDKIQIVQTVFTGEIFSAPNASITYNNKTREATSKLIYPSGKVKYANSCMLDEPGLYTVEYTAYFGELPIQENKNFTAVQHVYESDGKVKPYFGAPEEIPDRPGIVVTLGRGETFKYNRIIDFTNMTSTDQLINMYILPQTIGMVDARQILYTFTDTEDEENILNITQQAHYTLDDWAVRQTYLRAGGTGQPQSGWEWTGGPLHSGDKWGTATNFSMYGLPAATNYKNQTLNFQIDYKNLTLKTNNGTQDIVRFNDPQVFDTFWEGFKKGTAYLSITCGQFNNTSTRFVLTNVAGHIISDGDISIVRDEKKPNIVIDCSEENIPQAVVGCPYKLYNATVSDDFDKNPHFTRRVFVNYGSNMQAEYDVMAGGVFLPDHEGAYTVEYKAVDYFGNEQVKEIIVIAAERDDPLMISFFNEIKTCLAGELYSVADYSIKGAIGKYKVKVEAFCTIGKTIHNYEVKDGVFRPEYEAEYTVRYTVNDYIDSVSSEYKIIVQKGNIVKLLERPNLPRYMIVGSTYQIPSLTGIDYSEGTPRSLVAEIFTSGPVELKGNRLFVVSNGEITITYSVGSKNAKDSLSLSILAIDVGYGSAYHMQNYFYGQNSSISAYSGYVQIDVSSDSKIDFIKELDSNFQLVFDVNPLKKNFERLGIVVRDSKRIDQNITLIFFRNASGTACVSVNGGKKLLTEGSWNGNGSSFDISYDCVLRKLKIGSYINFTMGQEVKFSSGRVLIEFDFKDVSGNSALQIKSINNQVFSNATRDVVRPQISLLGSLDTEYALGSKIIVPAAVATDVLDSTVSFSLTAIEPDGSVLWTDSGKELKLADPSKEYTFTASKYGQYNFVLSATDSSGRKQETRFAVNVTDKNLPIIILEGAIPKLEEKGKRIILPKATVIDDSGELLSYYIYLIRPDQVLVSLFSNVVDEEGTRQYREDGRPILEYYDNIIISDSGIWKIIYYAADKSGNTTILIYEIVIS